MSKFKRRATTEHLIVHTSASPQGRGDDAVEIDRWHKERGFSAIGYHYVILENGVIQLGRPAESVGAHCKAQGRNHDSIGVVLIGEHGEYTKDQITSLRLLQLILNIAYPGILVSPHSKWDPERRTNDPGFDIEEVFAESMHNLIKDPLGYEMEDD